MYRILVTNALFLYSFLIVFTTGGSIEGHFHFFVIFLLLVMYYDWRLGWFGLVAVALHHGILNYVAPSWVYFYGRNDTSVIGHALPVLFTVLFTTIIAENGRRSVGEAAVTNKDLENRLRQKFQL
jgi:methyl-accepting chemotaxis protein